MYMIPLRAMVKQQMKMGGFLFLLNNQEKAELTFSHVAYETHHQVFDASETDIIVKMNETLIQLNNIVVTSTRSGYLLRRCSRCY